MNVIKSKIVPVKRKDVDTDLIIPAEFLTITTKEGLGKHLFVRIAEDLNLAFYKGRTILVAGENFGCGSSREHAPWALYDWGIRVVIAPSFADIFFNNAMKNGILPIVLDADLFDEDAEIEVDLEAQTVTDGRGKKHHFEIDPYRKECLMKGMDDLDYLLSNLGEIEEFDQQRVKHLFFDTDKL